MSEERAVNLIRSAGVGTLHTLLTLPPEQGEPETITGVVPTGLSVNGDMGQADEFGAGGPRFRGRLVAAC
ncbi:hypothetical protein GCM10010344_24380 [Streptomyces bluensis]|nr:hypothetical protein GCM10010344_24380 [Streptomyces bluensis]